MPDDQDRTIKIGRRTIFVSNPNKPFFPAVGLTKFDVVDYYRRIAPHMMPHLAGRALTVQRAPAGLKGESWYQQERPDWFADWLPGVSLPRREGGTVEHLVCRRPADLVYLAEQACLSVHSWLSLVDNPEKPDRMVFDLDPPKPAGDFREAIFAARRLRDILQEFDVPSFPMTTGSNGIHVLVPLRPESDFDQVRKVASDISHRLAGRYPERLTVEHRKRKRQGRVFLDYLRNAYGQTTVAPYSIRLFAEAPVATPLEWHELSSLDSARRYTVSNIFRRLGQKAEPWSGWQRQAIRLADIAERINGPD